MSVSKRCAFIVAAFVASLASAAERPTADLFLARYPGAWRIAPQPVTGDPAFVWGSRIASAVRPASDAEFEAAAREILDLNVELFGIGGGELALQEVVRIAASDTTPKVAVVFAQRVDDLEVYGGSVTVLFDAASGDVLALDSTGVPFARDRDVIPATSEADALEVARAAFEARFGVQAVLVDDVKPAIVGADRFEHDGPLAERGAALCWVFELSTPEVFVDELPAQARVFVSAEGDRTVFAIERTAHAAVRGTVRGKFTLGPDPNLPGNQNVVPLANVPVRVGGPAGPIAALTKADGTYQLANAGPVTVSISLNGPFFRVFNGGGTSTVFTVNAAVNQVVSATFNNVFTQFSAAEVATAHWINAFRNFVKTADPADTTMDFPVFARVNLTGHCNAFWNGTSINFYRAVNQPGAKCNNSAYRSGVHHEEGHWANARYNGNMTGAFHEGCADAWSYFINDDPCFWKDFHGAGTGCVRTGNQLAVKKCPQDGNEACHGGEVHDEGQVIASALWKVKRNLKNQLGAAAGNRAANERLLAWFRAFNDFRTLNVVLDHWLVLDDNDGDLTNGTPNFAAIQGAFVEQGWTGLAPFPTYGVGCGAVPNRKPKLSGIGSGKKGGATTVSITGGPAGAFGFLRCSLAQGNQPLPNGCTYLLGNLFSSAPFKLDGLGKVVGTFQNPNVAAATNFFMQAVITDNQAPNGYQLSNGLKVTITP